jgi:hypothetical protein
MEVGKFQSNTFLKENQDIFIGRRHLGSAKGEKGFRCNKRRNLVLPRLKCGFVEFLNGGPEVPALPY